MARTLVREKVPLQLMLEGKVVQASTPSAEEKTDLIYAQLSQRAHDMREAQGAGEELVNNLAELYSLLATAAERAAVPMEEVYGRAAELDADLGTYAQGLLLHGTRVSRRKRAEAKALQNPQGRRVSVEELAVEKAAPEAVAAE